MNRGGGNPSATGDRMVRYDRFVTLSRMREKGVSRYLTFPADLGIRMGDEVSLKVRRHGTDRWYSMSTKATRFGKGTPGVYLNKGLWSCMGAEIDDLLDIDVEVWYADDAGEQTEEGYQEVSEG